MSHPIDVGSVLGGRYKVTATVLTSHDQDLVLDGVDQVLNRPVSILVAGPGNADQVAQSAREVATGERPGNVQILDLGVSDATTYLITNHTSAADLLDLVVSSNPPYVEPFFTDTLGSEIFGQARSHEPETYDGLYDDEEVDAGYINYGQAQGTNAQPPASPAPPPAGVPSRPASAPAAAAAAAAAARAPKAPTTAPQETAAHSTAPQPVQNGGRPARPNRQRSSRQPPRHQKFPCGPTTTTPVTITAAESTTAAQPRLPEWLLPASTRRIGLRATSPPPPVPPSTRMRTSTSTKTRTSPTGSRVPCAGWWAGSWLPCWWSA